MWFGLLTEMRPKIRARLDYLNWQGSFVSLHQTVLGIIADGLSFVFVFAEDVFLHLHVKREQVCARRKVL